MRGFRVGDILYHKTNGTKCIVKEVLDNDIRIVLEKSIAGKKELVLPKTHIGEWLFYSKNHIERVKKGLDLPAEYGWVLDYELSELLKIRDSNEVRKIKQIVLSRDIRHLMHVTKIENIESILSRGFLPRSIMDEEGIRYVYNDETRRDGRLDCTSFSIEYPNSYLLNYFRKIYGQTIWAVIVLDAKLLYQNEEEILFCPHNAARSDISVQLWGGSLTTADAFQQLFCEKIPYRNGIEYRSSQNNIQPYLPTSVQAEVLIQGGILSRYIQSINLMNIKDYIKLRQMINNRKLLSKFNFHINDYYFNDRINVQFPNRRIRHG